MTDMTNKSRLVLITAPMGEHWLERLQGLSPDLQIVQWPTRSIEAVPHVLWQEVEILFTSFATPLPLPEQAPRLHWVQLYSAGPDRILDLLLRAGTYGDGFDARREGLSLARLREAEHGVDLGALEPRLPGLLATPSGKIARGIEGKNHRYCGIWQCWSPGSTVSHYAWNACAGYAS